MTNVQSIGPIGGELDLRDPDGLLLVADGFVPPDPHIETQLTTIPGGTVVVSRYDQNYKELRGTVLVRGATRTARKAALQAIQTAIADSCLYTTSNGRQGVAAFYNEQWGDEPSPTVYPIKVGYCKEKSRQSFWQQISCEFYLLLEPEL